MAEPRVFISSTFYDLRHVRADLDRFVRDMGYVPIRNEGGDIPYGNDEELEQYCYREIDRCDILLSILGGRFGHSSRLNIEYSISQMELRKAIELRKQVYVFVEKNVWHEYEIYASWPDGQRETFRPYHANDVRIHEFIAHVSKLPKNNPIFQFEASNEIVEICRRQWSGLFQSLLERQARRPEEDLVLQLKETLTVMRQLVDYLTQERKETGEAVVNILTVNHPAFSQVQRVLNLPFRVLFSNVSELTAILKERNFRPVPEIEWQQPERMEWVQKVAGEKRFLKVRRSLFGSDGRLVIASPDEWDPETIVVERSDG